ncbi:MAG: O-acetyl-ADP-ribose deacetylase [Longibaculum sp.]
MEIKITKGDITDIHCDAIVNAANNSLLGGGGVDGAIHRKAGPKLLKECRTLGGCATGDAKITKAYHLPAQYVIHTVGPVYRDGHHNEAQLLKSCYQRCLEIADEYQCQHIAFPSISTGAYRYPVSEAVKIAMETIQSFQLKYIQCVEIVCFDDYTYSIYKDVLENL